MSWKVLVILNHTEPYFFHRDEDGNFEDYLAIFDHFNDPRKYPFCKYAEMGYCGNANGNPLPFQSTQPGKEIYLWFKTNDKNEGVGFVVGYKEVGMYC